MDTPERRLVVDTPNINTSLWLCMTCWSTRNTLLTPWLALRRPRTRRGRFSPHRVGVVATAPNPLRAGGRSCPPTAATKRLEVYTYVCHQGASKKVNFFTNEGAEPSPSIASPKSETTVRASKNYNGIVVVLLIC